MKIYLKKKEHKQHNHLRKSYAIMKIDQCCDLALKNLRNQLIDLDYEQSPPVMNLVSSDIDDIEFSDPILYCPFCGSETKIEIIETVDITEQINDIEMHIIKLQEQNSWCDSISKSRIIVASIKAAQKEYRQLISNDTVRYFLLRNNEEV